MVTAYIVSLLVNFVPPCIIIWSMLFELFKTVGYKKGDKWPMIMLAGVLYMSTMGGFVSPFQTGVVGNFGILTAASGGTLTYDPIRYFIWAFICGSVLLALWILFAKYVIKPDVSPLKRDDLFIRDETPLSNLYDLCCWLAFTKFFAGKKLFESYFCESGQQRMGINHGLSSCSCPIKR